MTVETLGNLLTNGLETHRVTIAKNGFVVITEYVPPEFVRRDGRAELHVYGAGMYDVSMEQLGVPHGLEHMLEERSAGRQTGEYYIRLSDRKGPIHNAEVHMRHTEYWAKAPNHALLDGLSSLLKQFFEARLLEEEIQIEKGSMKDEVRIIASTPEKFSKLLARGILFDVDPFTFTETGTENDIDRITREDLIMFRKLRYTPENMTLFVTGSVQYGSGTWAERADRFHSDVLERVSKYVDIISGGSIATVGPPVTQPIARLTNFGLREEHLDIPDSFYAKVVQNGDFRGDSQEGLAIELLTRVLDRRMFNTIRLNHGQTYGAECDYEVSPEGLLVSTVSFHPSAKKQVIDTVHGIEQEISRVGVSQEEFRVQSSRLINDYKREYREGTSLLRRSRDVRFAHSSFEHIMATLKTLTPLDVQRAAQYISSKPHAEVLLGQ